LNSQWVSFARVFSTADTVRQAVKLGGHVLETPTVRSDGATTAILEDPTGAAFGVIELLPKS
jgi:predicted enzyme related to lactoylglutathione lyase